MRHIDNLDDCHDIAARGFKWATIVARGNRRGEIRSVHVTLEAAKRAGGKSPRSPIPEADLWNNQRKEA